MKKCPDPEWYVYIYDSNARKIKRYNVFHSFRFNKCCKDAFKKFRKTEQIDELKKEIKSSAMYSFWSKYEYEIMLSGLPAETEEQRIDVYDQLCMNWDAFFEYTFEHKAYFLRR